MRVLIDMDGILTDLLGKWLAAYNDDHGDTLEVSELETFEVHDYVRPEVGRRVYRYLEEPRFFDDLHPLPGALEAFHQLSKRHDLRVATSAASPDSARAKLEWCARYLGISRRSVFICHDKAAIACDAVIDDKPSTLRAFHELERRPLVATIAYPYNREVREICDIYARDYANTEAAWESIVRALG